MSHDNPLRGRTAVVTGAARGLGAGLARDLAARGMRIALLGRERETLERVARELPAGSR
ncbi:SDR family NAD(P)-dependent oxidoreductase, partial [Streptomyces sp. NPDC056295]